ncbi:ParA family protein [Chryseobacterium fistulae]|uniref:Iron-sulfur cluster carrier protein n=1 Tax=Chryseobacterium fistulae TaxID=2675058 RepID=A0A6N4XSP7_9FLAO|nr:ParA family protein [Chryseobacterium fistulae]CAA7392425.1 Iron-sulfur cluster carrier protein [Chryseobacterium fistulae]
MAKLILATHQKGGVGKSTLTYNLAFNMKDSAKVAMIDVDYQGSLVKIGAMSEVPIYTLDKLEEVMNSDYDFIFVDTPPYLSEELPDLYKLADVIIIPTKAGIFDVLAMEDTVNLIKENQAEKKGLIVFNMIRPNTTLTEEIKNQASQYELRIANTMISDLVAFGRSVMEGGVSGNNNAQRQIDNLSKEIFTLLIQ